jgi:hypothetical protein
MRINANEMAIEILATGKAQIVDQHTIVMSHMWLGQRQGFKAHGAPIKTVGSATYNETTVNVNGAEMRRMKRGNKGYPQDGHIVWVVSKLQHADGTFIAFAAKVLDERNL